jgi:hypothetical protein
VTEGFSHFVTSMTVPVASGWSVRRVGLHRGPRAAVEGSEPELEPRRGDDGLETGAGDDCHAEGRPDEDGGANLAALKVEPDAAARADQTCPVRRSDQRPPTPMI